MDVYLLGFFLLVVYVADSVTSWSLIQRDTTGWALDCMCVFNYVLCRNLKN